MLLKSHFEEGYSLPLCPACIAFKLRMSVKKKSADDISSYHTATLLTKLSATVAVSKGRPVDV